MAGNKCECCQTGQRILTAHHIHYHNHFNEKPDDLVCLCRKCHKPADRLRKSSHPPTSRMELLLCLNAKATDKSLKSQMATVERLNISSPLERLRALCFALADADGTNMEAA